MDRSEGKCIERGRPSTASELMANAIAFSLTLPLLRQIAFESTDYGWWFHKPENMGMNMRRNRFLGDEVNQFGGHQQSKQAFHPKPLDSQDDFQVAGKLPEKADNIGFFESGFATAEDSSSDYALFGNDATYAAWNTPWGGTEFTENITTAVKKSVAPDYYFIGTEQFDDYAFWYLNDVVNPQTGKAANLYVDTKGGNDCVWTGDGHDVIKTGGSANSRGVTIRSEGGDDTVFGTNGDDVIMLGAGDNVGFGGDGNDVIVGGGADLIDGGGGMDWLFGSSDSDAFVIDLSGETDLIVDFNNLGDKIQLKDSLSNNLITQGDWFIRSSRSVDPVFDQIFQHPVGTNGGADCFDLVSASGSIAASICVNSLHSLNSDISGSELFLKATGNTLEIVDEASANLSIQI